MKYFYKLVVLVITLSACSTQRKIQNHGMTSSVVVDSIQIETVSVHVVALDSAVDNRDDVDRHFDDLTSVNSKKEEERKFEFGKEKSGTVCVNGLEKLELAAGTDRAINGMLQLHFNGPGITSGRVFFAGVHEKGEHGPMQFADASVDGTIYEFPLHLSYSFGWDQIAKKSNVSYTGPGFSLYLSDVTYLDVSHLFHILRFSMSYNKMIEHSKTMFPDVDGVREDSSFTKGYAWETVAFYQIQPYHITHNLTLFSEGLFKARSGNNFMEFELGLRHEKILEGMVGLGLRASFEDMHFHKVSAILRFSLSSPNPRHLGLKQKRWKF